MWVARNKDKSLVLWFGKPTRGKLSWIAYEVDAVCIDEDLFPEVTWKDEPIEVELIIKK